ncbi:AraC family transcriptional regulator [Vibrio parahaemolyticus]|uniref:AraC family transcriptional regulator n=1 Tax=Vibrio parahaemolyticus TaxID=670 RepID=A0AAX0MH60_VIBPH|nr:helix-turn-helix domain-containing protein [Vibrio parahaemolyticus]EVU12404.1 urease operon transcriptional activator [Vibrio parahaemolyticus V-223/04]KIT55325.1 AraC family transcriptional regulator [Vibrio parahaemolyticus EN9701121]ANQ58858.1 AraC family transcriptional regulator [Vibrio parahaemolyticus]ASO14062.1 AraC family transcriptional regulator [Vibrio parahaemolyticus]ASZ50207.1 AraC family transcriptional regulator [Vibrio parahaemolyticus]
MEYKNIQSSKSFTLKEFYVEKHYIVSISFAKGDICINEQQIDIDNPCVVIVPKYSRVSCTLTPKSPLQSMEAHFLIFTDEMLKSAFARLVNKHHQFNHQPMYQLPTPLCVERNFQIMKETSNAISEHASHMQLLEQGLFFILLTLNESGVDVHNVFHFNYEEPKKETIARLITQDPQRKWHIDDIAKLLFTTPSTLRRHLRKEGVIFSQLLLDVRMGLALNFLTFTNYTVSQISYRTGFGSSAYFCDAFKRKYSVTPLQFRVQSRENNDLQTLKNLAMTNKY